ncbi:hypothetical protein FFF34_014795 [Inquilinus sp. KBS0705]|nr:hypothetical protein FFF34_014795 [Inquilinus sp. KBS0705]
MIEKSPELIPALLFILLKKIQKLFSGASIDRNIKHQIVVYKKFKHLVEQNFFKHSTITAYADKLNITTHFLNSTVKAICNKTASDVIKERVILEAKQLLQFSDKTISEITELLNFKASSYLHDTSKKTRVFPRWNLEITNGFDFQLLKC